MLEARGVSWILLTLLTLLVIPQSSLVAGGDGISIVVTFQFMVDDIKSLLCSGDEVTSIVPQGVDPHEYQLTYSDLAKLAAADLIVSTAHTPFEMKIREMVMSGELKAELIEIPKIPGMVFLSIPSVNTTNYHGTLFYGRNYVAFINNVSDTLSRLRPECADWYRGGARVATRTVEELEGGVRPLSGLKAVVDIPPLQYIATWLGAEVVRTLLVEHDVPASPQDVEKVERIVEGLKDGVVLVFTEDSTARGLMEEIASRYGARVLALPNPVTSTSSVLLYMQKAVERALNVRTPERVGGDISVATQYLVVAAVVVAVVALLITLGRRVWR